MLFHWVSAYKKPFLIIAALNVSTVAAITVAWNSTSFQQARAAQPQELAAPRCSGPSGYAHPSAFELKARAERVFRRERTQPTADGKFLMALSMALGFRHYERVEALLNQYECGRTL